MRYLAININFKLDQDWYFRTNSVLECYKYFDMLGPGHGPRIAIFDMEMSKYIWINAEYSEHMERIGKIVRKAIRKSNKGRKTNL